MAGPVTVGIVMCEEKLYAKLKRNNLPAGVAGRLPPLGKDSKKLSPESREKYAKVLEQLQKGTFCTNSAEGALLQAQIVHISNKEIDKIGISKCIKKAIAKGFGNLDIKNYLKIKNFKLKILLDGGLKVPAELTNGYSVKQVKQFTIIKGDEKEKIIAWASILAKVSRDKLMCKASKKYPLYNFHIHKGYGTLAHRTAIQTHGLSLFHRKSFCKNLV